MDRLALVQDGLLPSLWSERQFGPDLGRCGLHVRSRSASLDGWLCVWSYCCGTNIALLQRQLVPHQEGFVVGLRSMLLDPWAIEAEEPASSVVICHPNAADRRKDPSAQPWQIAEGEGLGEVHAPAQARLLL